MDTSVPDEYLRRLDVAAHERHPYLATNPSSIAYAVLEGRQQLIHVGHQQFYNQFAAQR